MFAFLLGFSLQMQAQTSEPDYMNTPNALNSFVSTELINDIYNNQVSLVSICESQSRKNIWVVYSDRDNNELYDSPGGFPNGDELNFMEDLVVEEVKESGGKTWLKVYNRVKITDTGTERNKYRGWINVKNLLINNFALLNEKSIPRKAMAIISIQEFQESKTDKRKYYFYKKPDEKTSVYGESKTFQIYYVLKDEGSYMLLSKTDKISGKDDRNVSGWMHGRNITRWDTRICYEPNSSQEAYDSYKGKDIFVLAGVRPLKRFIETETVDPDEIIKREQIQARRKASHIMRMPNLENLKTDYSAETKRVITVQSMGKTLDETVEGIKEKFEALNKKVRKVNILFVVDATESMKPFYPKIRESLNEIISDNESFDANISLRFGLSIYRDYPDGEEVCEVTTLTSNEQKIIDKLNATQCYSSDKDKPEAVYKGLVTGIENVGFNKDYSNVVVLIGDAGNHIEDPEGYKLSNIVDALAKYNASFIGFQVAYSDHNSYAFFQQDIKDILVNTSRKHVKNPRIVQLESLDKLENTGKLTYQEIKDMGDELFMFGRYTYASGNRQMDPNILKENIVTSLNNYLKKTHKQLSTYNGLLENAQTEESDQEYSEEFIHHLKIRDFTDDEIDVLKSYGEVTMQGYLATRYYNQDEHCYVPVVFLSEEEKKHIDKMLEDLTMSHVNRTEQKKQLQDAIVEQCHKLLGNKSNEETNNIILNKTIDEIWEILLAIPYKGSPTIKNMKLKNLSTDMSDDVFEVFYGKFQRKANAFINKDFRDSRFEIIGEYYYWIPLENMP